MTAEIIWLVNGTLAHITVTVEWSELTGRTYSIAWLMGPDGVGSDARPAHGWLSQPAS